MERHKETHAKLALLDLKTSISEGVCAAPWIYETNVPKLDTNAQLQSLIILWKWDAKGWVVRVNIRVP